jgi:anhydro-N-acetylmuramic acid kinase
MLVLGMMSGTSADGIDAALVRISGAPPSISAKFVGHFHARFRPRVRQVILRIANGGATTACEISQLNFLLGEEFGSAAVQACRRWRVPLRKISLVASHGQTIFHQGKASRFLGTHRVASTLQIGEPSIIAIRTGVTTIADFRPGDMAAGGQGAPLVPFVDYLLYRDGKVGRVALNIGGIANVTLIPAGARAEDVLAFDTGPGNMLIDALIERITSGRSSYDKDARVALRGQVIRPLLEEMLHHPYLRISPPKTAGREQFGLQYADRLMKWAKKRRARPEDLVRTVTIFTALSIADAFRRFIFPRARANELVVAGGGTQNPLLMAQLGAALPGIEILKSSHFGIPAEAKEAFAFAVLGYEAFHVRANNLPSATGAKHVAILGTMVRPYVR